MRMLREVVESGEFAITCEFVPGRGMSGPAIDAPVDFAHKVIELGANVHAASLTDNPGGNPAILPDILGAEIIEEGIDALVHFSCRDLNRNGIESRAMSLARQGVHSLLVITGDYPESAYEGAATPVFDLDSVQAIKYLKAMSAGLEIPGRKRGTTTTLPPTGFFIGAGISPFKYSEEELLPQYFKMEKKIHAGADFIIPQLGYDMRKFLEIKRYLASRGHNVPVFGNVYVLSFGAGKMMNSGGVPGCVVTDELLAVLKEEAQAEDKGKAARLERAAKMVAMFRGMEFNGVHLGGFALKPQDFLFILQRADELQDRWEEFIPEVSFGQPGEFYAFPEPTTYVLSKAAPDPDPLNSIGTVSKPLAYRFARMIHAVMFEPKSPVYRMMQWYFGKIPAKGWLYRRTHSFEWWVKRQIFGCRDCGDCAMMGTAYCCPMANCAKKQRNGPCGGSRNGMCEAFPDEKPCVWTSIYARLKSSGELTNMRDEPIPARNAALENTSGWANFYLGKDHHHQAVPEKKPEEK